MFLKRLEIQGFKSFAKNTVLTFEPGITAIVGPNGSGKSNIADAVRWVLGEQSKALLRGKKAEDVIFVGSSSKSRAAQAYVSVVFDNGDTQVHYLTYTSGSYLYIQVNKLSDITAYDLSITRLPISIIYYP